MLPSWSWWRDCMQFRAVVDAACMSEPIVFPGNEEERISLLTALEHNCVCQRDVMGAVTQICGPHEMLRSDQRALNGLVCERRRQLDLIKQEHMPEEHIP